MTAATTVVNRALRLLNLGNGILPVDPAHQAVAFDCLVDVIKMLRGDGINFLRQIPATISADLKEPAWSTAGLIEMLARHAAPFLQAVVPESLGYEGERVIRNRARPPIGCSLPETLPVGGGNYDDYTGDHFYIGSDGVEYDFVSSARIGESETYYADFSYDASLRATSVSSVVWSNEKNATAGISGQSLSADVASALLTFSASGDVAVRARATYDNGEIKDFLFSVSVV